MFDLRPREKKQIFVMTFTVLLITIIFSGCNEQTSESDGNGEAQTDDSNGGESCITLAYNTKVYGITEKVEILDLEIKTYAIGTGKPKISYPGFQPEKLPEFGDNYGDYRNGYYLITGNITNFAENSTFFRIKSKFYDENNKFLFDGFDFITNVESCASDAFQISIDNYFVGFKDYFENVDHMTLTISES